MKSYPQSYYGASPASILPAELACWYDFSNPVAGTVFSDGALLPLIQHQLHNGRPDAAQPTPANQGVYRIGSTTAPSKLPIMRTSGNQGYQTSDFGLGPSSFTLLIAGKFPVEEDDSLFVEFGPNATANDGFYLWGSQLNPNLYITNNVSSLTVSGPAAYISSAGFNIFVARMNAQTGTAQLYVKNNLMASATNPLGFSVSLYPLNIAARNNVAGPQKTIGDWGELILYDVAISDTQMLYIINYLSEKWLGVPL